MIRIFDIKNSKNDLKSNDNEIFKNYLTESKENTYNSLQKYKSTLNGLSEKEVKKRLIENGKNVVIKDEHKVYYNFIIPFFN